MGRVGGRETVGGLPLPLPEIPSGSLDGRDVARRAIRLCYTLGLTFYSIEYKAIIKL